ncbi:MAG: ferritin-like domain-containing protein [Acidobacteria bacterium]|nr:ferritin-like domain-containing protein [Acidobacteriota bacterium]
MVFETKKDVLDWYERQERTLTPKYVSAIDWAGVRSHSLDEKLVPVLFYMRDVETLTDMYYRELRRTPTGKDPHISKFMERWGVEELTHGELLNRFLNELGYESDEKWQDQVKRAVSREYHANSYMITTLTNLVGKRFTATHMTFGAIHEMSTLQAYRRLSKIARHPVLTYLLDGIIREESAHSKFYWSVARLELGRSRIARRLSRSIIEHFWAPVGQGSIPKERTDYTIATLFGDAAGIDVVDKLVTQRIRRLPGFTDLTKINETAKRIAAAAMQPGIA